MPFKPKDGLRRIRWWRAKAKRQFHHASEDAELAQLFLRGAARSQPSDRRAIFDAAR